MSIDALYEQVEQSRKLWQEIYDSLVNASYDVASGRPSIGGLTLEQLHRKAVLIFETFLSIRPQSIQNPSWVALSGRTAEASSALTSFKSHAEGVANHLRPHIKDGTTIRDGNSNFLLNFYHNDANTANIDLTNFFVQLNSSLNTLLNSLGTVLPFCESRSIGDVSERAQALGEVLRETEVLRNEARKLKQAAEQSASQAAAKEKAIQDLFTKAETTLSQLQALQTQGNLDAGSVAALVEKIKTIGSSADTLENQVEAYKSAFEAFQTSLEKRNTDFLQFEANSKAAEQANIERETEIDRLTALADSMISGATTAGLAKSMEDARARYEKRMNDARIGFYVAVAILVASAIPLVGHLLPGLFSTWFPGADIKPDTNPYALVSKIALLVPATWLTAFFTKSYADFFHLEREYAHKAALAMSVDGFKRQAQKYQEEITAEVFMEIRMNPAHRLGTEPASHPLYDVLSKAVGKFLDRERKAEEKP